MAMAPAPLRARDLQTSNMASGLATESLIATRPRLRNVEYEDVVVDAAYAQLLRHHTSSLDELAEAVSFSQEVFSFRQLQVLLAHMGPRLPILAEDVHVERKNRGAVLRATIRFSLNVRWTSGRLQVGSDMLPDTTHASIVGMPMHRIVDHPYIPRDLVVDSIETNGGSLVLLPARST